MAFLLPCQNSEAALLADVVDYVSAHVDHRDPESILGAAPLVRAVANNRALFFDTLHQQMREDFALRKTASCQVVTLGGGGDFYLRFDIWPTAAAVSSPLYQEQASAYEGMTIQSFPALMTGAIGPGLPLDLYRFDADEIQRNSPDPLTLDLSDQVVVGCENAVLLMPQGEAVSRRPPSAISVTLSLIFVHETGDMRSIARSTRTLMNLSRQLLSTRRAAMIELASLMGDASTDTLLDQIALTHPQPRTRQAAYEGLVRRSPVDAQGLWRRAATDPELEAEALRRLAAGFASP